MKILVVDDARVMRNIVTNAIKENYKGSVQLLEAEDGMKALKIVNENKIDLVCVDWNMPKLDGLEFVKKIRAMDPYKTLPLLMITSEAAKYMIVEAVEAGVTDYILKPIVGKNLWAKLMDYFPKKE